MFITQNKKSLGDHIGAVSRKSAKRDFHCGQELAAHGVDVGAGPQMGFGFQFVGQAVGEMLDERDGGLLAERFLFQGAQNERELVVGRNSTYQEGGVVIDFGFVGQIRLAYLMGQSTVVTEQAILQIGR